MGEDQYGSMLEIGSVGQCAEVELREMENQDGKPRSSVGRAFMGQKDRQATEKSHSCLDLARVHWSDGGRGETS